MCVESATKNALNIQQFIWSICPTGQNIWDMSEKKTHRASVFRGSSYNLHTYTVFLVSK